MTRFKEIMNQYSNKPVDFLVIYIEEIHPADGWAAKTSPYQVNQHKTSEDRIAAAKPFVENTGLSCPVIVDNPGNEANSAYGALPERLYIISRGKIAYVGGQGPVSYNLDEMLARLNELIRKNLQNSL